MAEVLSQSQIDALLKGLTTPGAAEVPVAPAQKIKEYDFKTPKKFTKEQLKTLNSLHDNFARFLSSYISGAMRVYCEARVSQIEEYRYYEYNNALPDSVLIGMVNMKPKDDNLDESIMLVDMSPSLGFFMIDRLLGGSGDGFNVNREFSDIEIAIMQNVFTKLTTYLQESWSNYIDVKTDLHSIETNSRLMQAYMPDDTVVIVLIDVKLKNLSGTMTICIPAINLEEMIDQFSTRVTKSEKKRDIDKEEYRKQLILESIRNSELQMNVVLDKIDVDLHDILSLQVNDIIPLNKKVDEPASVIVEDAEWFNVMLGQTRTKRAIKIDGIKIDLGDAVNRQTLGQ